LEAARPDTTLDKDSWTVLWHIGCASPMQVPYASGGNMLWTIVIILLVLWLLGLVSGYTLGGLLHILLIVAIIVVLIRVIQGRRPV
jgi:hypothetical protein